MRRALDAAVAVEQPRHVQRPRVPERERGELGERSVEQLAVRVEQHAGVVVGPLHAGVARRPEARVVAPLDQLGAPLHGEV
jgi:hypothetical protein